MLSGNSNERSTGLVQLPREKISKTWSLLNMIGSLIRQHFATCQMADLGYP